MILLKNVQSPGIVNQTPRSIRSYIGDIFTPNPTFLLTLLTRKSWFTSSHTAPNPRYFFLTHVTRSNDSFILLS